MRTARFARRIAPVTFVATLISSPAEPSITDDVLAEARRILGTRHPTRVLHGEVAAEVLVDADTSDAQALEEKGGWANRETAI